MRLTRAQIDRIESSLGISLPGLYRKLLVEIGPGTLPSGNEIYHPDKVLELYEPFFDEPAQIFNPYFPFGCDNNRQELWIIDAGRQRAASIWHETVPDDWPEEEWLEYDQWVAQYLQLGSPSET